MGKTGLAIILAMALVLAGAAGAGAAPFAYIASYSSNTVSVIDTATNMVTAMVPVASSPRCLAVSPDGLRVYFGNIASNTVSVIDTATDTVTATVPVGVALVLLLKFATYMRHPSGVTATPLGVP